MKKLFYLLFFLFSIVVNGQDLMEKQLEIEKKIEIYVSQSIKNYKLPESKILEIKKNIELELIEHNEVFDENKFVKTIANIKNNELRRKYFELHPDDLLIFTNPTIFSREVMQSCTDGDFENWPVAVNPYIFKRGNAGFGGANINTQGGAFVPFAVGTGVNQFNNFATLVSPGNDPQAGAVQRVNNGQRAIKLNIGESDNSPNDVVTMSRSFIINENFFDFSYSVILNNPSVNAGGAHTLDSKPFFLVRLYDADNNIIRTVTVSTDPNDC